MRRAARVDENQRLIVKHLEQVGATVELLHRVGGGVPDLLVGWRGENFLIEVKDGDKAPSRRRLNDQQKRWHMAWKGHRAVCETPDEALRVIGAI